MSKRESCGSLLTLGDLAAETRFGLKLLVPCDGWNRRVVRGAHGTEVAEPMRWMDPGWMMLTTGMRLRRRSAERAPLVWELAREGASALGFGVGHSFDHVPQEVVHAAREAGLPVFEVPFETPFSEISAFAARAHTNHEFLLLRRVMSMQNFLLDSLQHHDPEDELLRRLAGALNADLVLFRPDGELQLVHRRSGGRAASPDPRSWAAPLWIHVADRPHSVQRFLWRERHVTAVPVRSDGRLCQWLVLVASRDGASAPATSIVEAAGNVLGAAASTLRIRAARERMEGAQLVDLLMSPDREPDAEALRPRLAVAGLDFTDDVCAIHVAPRSRNSAVTAMLESLDELCLRLQLRHVATSSPTGIYALAQGDPNRLETELSEMLADSADVAGVGRPASSPELARRSLADAVLAVQQLRSAHGSVRTLRFEALDIAACLLSSTSLDDVRCKAADMLAPLKAKPFLYESLQCFMSLNLDVARTAKALHLHPNSLRYRLSKIEELVGGSLHAPATIANLHLAMLVETVAPGVSTYSEAA